MLTGVGSETAAWGERGLGLVRTLCGDAQGMDIGFHQVAYGRVNQLVTMNSALAIELSGDNVDVKVSFSGFGPGMSGVSVAFISNFQFDRRKCRGQTGPNFLNPFLIHGRTTLKGFTRTL